MNNKNRYQIEFEKNGFTLFPFSEDLRNELIDYIDGYIRRLASDYLGAKQSATKSLKELAMGIPDPEWSEKMTRAHRIFPKAIGERVHQWAFENIGRHMGKSRSAVNVVYPEEVKTNPSLDYSDLAIYWRCVRPGKPDAGRAHRDSGFWELEHSNGFDPKIPFPYNYLKDSIKIWIPLKGCTPSTTLQIVPLSHVMEIDTSEEDTEYGRRPSISQRWLQAHESDFMSPKELSQNSCLAFDMNLVHRGPIHANSELRISAELCLVTQ